MRKATLLMMAFLLCLSFDAAGKKGFSLAVREAGMEGVCKTEIGADRSFSKAVREAVSRQMKAYPKSTLADLYKNFFQDKFGPGHIIADTSSAGRYLRKELASYELASYELAEAETLSSDKTGQVRSEKKTVRKTGTSSKINAGHGKSELSGTSQKSFTGSEVLADNKGLHNHVYGPLIEGAAAEPTGWKGNFYRVNLSVIKKGQIPYAVFFDAFVRSVNGIRPITVAAWHEEWNRIEKIIRSMNLHQPDYETDRQAIEDRLNSGKYVGEHSDTFIKAYDPHYRIVSRDIFEKELKPYLERN
jgi:hypothetical protein